MSENLTERADDARGRRRRGRFRADPVRALV